MAAENSKDSVGGGSGRVGPGPGDGFFYQHDTRGEGEDGRLDLALREAGCVLCRVRQKEAGAILQPVARSI